MNVLIKKNFKLGEENIDFSKVFELKIEGCNHYNITGKKNSDLHRNTQTSTTIIYS